MNLKTERRVIIMTDKPIVSFSNVSVTFEQGTKHEKVALKDVSFDIHTGEVFGLVGESGSGKTTLSRTLLGILKPQKGQIDFNGQDIQTLNRHEMKSFKQSIQMIFQDPSASLNSRMKVSDIIAEGLDAHKLYTDKADRQRKVTDILRIVGLKEADSNRYPHEFSGGQRQRIGIARALIMHPKFVIADEPISALDVSIQAQVINLMQELKETLDLTYLFIAHDLPMVQHISDRIGVLYHGELVEVGPADEVFNNPLHPYTQTLIRAVPVEDAHQEHVWINPRLSNGETNRLVQVSTDRWVRATEEQVTAYRAYLA